MTKKFQWEVSQIAEKKIANRYGIRWFKCKLKPPKNDQNLQSNFLSKFLLNYFFKKLFLKGNVNITPNNVFNV